MKSDFNLGHNHAHDTNVGNIHVKIHTSNQQKQTDLAKD